MSASYQDGKENKNKYIGECLKLLGHNQDDNHLPFDPMISQMLADWVRVRSLGSKLQLDENHLP